MHVADGRDILHPPTSPVRCHLLADPRSTVSLNGDNQVTKAGAPNRLNRVASCTQSARVATFELGLALLDAEPDWARLWVVEVHPAYASRVLAAVEARLSDLTPSAREHSLKNWRRMCNPERDR